MESVSAALLITGAILAVSSVVLARLAVRELGTQWRLQAVVTRSHRLITTGPYSLVRHPVYSSLFLMLLANAFIVAGWKMRIAAVVSYLIGTEIRVAAEERLLSENFGAEFKAYHSCVRGYIPFLR